VGEEGLLAEQVWVDAMNPSTAAAASAADVEQETRRSNEQEEALHSSHCN
jgi:hypothetical protein